MRIHHVHHIIELVHSKFHIYSFLYNRLFVIIEALQVTLYKLHKFSHILYLLHDIFKISNSSISSGNLHPNYHNI